MPRGRAIKSGSDVLRDDRYNFVDKELSKQVKQNVYTSELIDNLIEKFQEGDPSVDMNPFFHGDINLRNADLTYEYTPHEWEEL
jgi:hypothetical protein